MDPTYLCSMAKLNALQAISLGKCPRCRIGDIHKKHILNPFSLTAMHKTCPHCGLRYEKETGFFYGGMYISYGISTALFLVVGFSVFYLFNDPPAWVYISIISAAVLLIFPYNFKYSRVIFLYLFGDEGYDPKYTD